ncbi:drebrin-like protein A [Astatotilapia calliptera]|uniref:Drebrin-like a n=1 Tax=Maylandia zebra TaxID=106582 RepID=A0A3P9D8X1_9CICH|nr:drebrin-like protein A [Maylandia zebra]XP_026030771.1 drebrin-like protein A [Astatotilapia calliptera]
MSVNLSKNGAALMAAYEEVVSGKSNTDWALFTYEGNTNNLRVAQKGDGGLEEMVEELNSGKVMYAFCRVRDPNSGLPKYILINWTGEGVKDSRKGQCANHVSTIAGFLKGAHVTVNARAEDDVDPETILAKVAKASGANFNFHKQTQEYRDVPRGPVGSVYRKVNAVEEIQQINKDDFWVKAQRDEEMRQKEESIRVEQERQEAERERRDMEERQSKERERIARERAQQIEQEKLRQKQREDEEREQEQQRRNEQLENMKMTGISAAASVQKANEAKSLISQRAFNPRDIFKQKEQSFDAGDTPAASRPGRLQSPFLSQKSFERDVPVQPRFPPSSPPAVTPLSLITSASPVLPVSHAAPASTTAPERSHSPVQPADAGYGDEDEWSDDFDEDEAAQEGSPAQDDPYMAPHSAWSNEDLYQNVSQHAPAADGINWDGSGQGICARALYDYQAADDTEITFDPDDIITQIEMLDEGWWRGVGPDGEYGMFPANYVELI